MNEFSIMSQFETKYACFMCATEFPGSDTISLGIKYGRYERHNFLRKYCRRDNIS